MTDSGPDRAPLAGESFRPLGVVVAGTRSGCGKTTLACGLMAALGARGLAVAPFKAGPDFIDPSHHAAITGRASHNLDGWMIGLESSRDIFARSAHSADIAVVEGVMGLYDGLRGDSEEGSTAELAKALGLPVLLVVDASSAARSVAAVVKGFAGFDPDLTLAGVVFNRVASSAHRELLLAAMTGLPDIPVLGCLGRDEALDLPARHLGLHMGEESGWTPQRVRQLAGLLESALDLPRLLERLESLRGPALNIPADPPPPKPLVRIGLARDAAFCFYYEENLRLLRQAGAELLPFSPLADSAPPPNLDGLYLGGGYPELHARALSENTRMRRAILDLCLSGAPVLAECGGLMYLSRSLRNGHDRLFRMTGAIPAATVMAERHSALGYRAVTTLADSPLGPAGTPARGHEFHYSRLDPPLEGQRLYAVTSRRGVQPDEGFLQGHTLASYIHPHFASNPDLPRNFVRACLDHRQTS